MKDGILRSTAMRLLASPEAVAKEAAEQILAAGQWAELVRLCERWKAIPALAARLTALGIDIPSTDAANLRRIAAQQFIQTTLCIRAGCDAMRALASAGIPSVGFKGLAVIAQLHSGPRDRMLQDVDVLIRFADLQPALELLELRGYSRSVGGDLADYLAFVRNSPGAAGNQAASLTSRDGAALDLHWKLGRFDTGDLLSAARPVRVLNAEAPVTRPAHGVLLTVHHALRNDLVPDEMARDVLDCAGWFRLLAAEPGELACALDFAKRWGLEDGLRALATIVERFGGQQPIPLTHSGAAAHLADLYFRQLESEPINTDLAYLVSGRSALQVLSGAMSGWKRYASLMREFESANGEQSMSLRERLKRLAVSAREMPVEHWRQIRALARAKDRFL